MGNSITAGKPRKVFPLTQRKSDRRWCKKVRGKIHYFGTDADTAMAEWKRVQQYLLAGNEPPAKDAPPADNEGMDVGELCDRFLQAKAVQRDSGELSHITWNDYKRTCDRVVAHFGKRKPVAKLTAADFTALKGTFAKTRGLVGIGNEIQRVRVAFNWAVESGLIEPLRYRQEFKRPGNKSMRKHRAKQNAEHGKKLFSADEVKRLLADATPTLQAMILLAVNCGFGPSDLATLPMRALDLAGGWVDHARPKTGIDRRCPLWPETVTAIKAALAKRRKPKDEAHARLVFITAALDSFAKTTTDSPITKGFAKLLKKLTLQQKGRGFYSLRHTFRTVARHAKDLEAARYIMGHSSDNESEESYLEEPVSDDRLHAVVDHVRVWLFSEPAKAISDKSKPNTKRSTRHDEEIRSSSRAGARQGIVGRTARVVGNGTEVRSHTQCAAGETARRPVQESRRMPVPNRQGKEVDPDLRGTGRGDPDTN